MKRRCFAFFLATAACSSPASPAPPRPTPPPSIDAGDADAVTACTEPAPSADHECVRDCGPPVVRPEDPEPVWRWLTADEAARRREYGCPRCLQGTTRIATPSGERAVAELAVGDAIWTLDRTGQRVAGRVVHVGSTPISGPHLLVRLTLADGRVVAASAEHPDATGRALAELTRGAALSGSTVVAIERVPLAGSRTYDVLPSGDSGAYWAEGVVLRSTFAAPRRDVR